MTPYPEYARKRPVDTVEAYNAFIKDYNDFVAAFIRFQARWDEDPEMPLEWIADWLCDMESGLTNMVWRVSLGWYERNAE